MIKVLELIISKHWYVESAVFDHTKKYKLTIRCFFQKNMGAVMMKDFEKYAEHNKKMKERQAAQAHTNLE